MGAEMMDERIVNPSPFDGLRADLVDALYQSAGCRDLLCTKPECCLPLFTIMDQVGLMYVEPEASFSSKLEHSHPQYFDGFGGVDVLMVLGMIVRTGKVLTRDMFADFLEIPHKIGVLLYGNNREWAKKLRSISSGHLSPTDQERTVKAFLIELSALALTDQYLLNIQKSTS